MSLFVADLGHRERPKNNSKDWCSTKLNYFFLLLKLPLPFFGFTIRFLYFLVNISIAVDNFLAAASSSRAPSIKDS